LAILIFCILRFLKFKHWLIAEMRNALIIAFSITICFIAFVISKIVISVLLYKRWRRKQMVHEEGYPGMEEKGDFFLL